MEIACGCTVTEGPLGGSGLLVALMSGGTGILLGGMEEVRGVLPLLRRVYLLPIRNC